MRAECAHTRKATPTRRAVGEEDPRSGAAAARRRLRAAVVAAAALKTVVQVQQRGAALKLHAHAHQASRETRVKT
jgi:hypothetical protein